MWNVEERKIMIITRTHVLYWQSRQVPSWAKGVLTADAISIDRAVNDHVPLILSDSLPRLDRNKQMAQYNAIGLLKLVRKNQAYDRKCGRPDTLLNYMHTYETQDGRYPIYKRWVRKYAIQMIASHFTRLDFIT